MQLLVRLLFINIIINLCFVSFAASKAKDRFIRSSEQLNELRTATLINSGDNNSAARILLAKRKQNTAHDEINSKYSKSKNNRETQQRERTKLEKQKREQSLLFEFTDVKQILDAPKLKKDFRFNLMSCSSQGILATALDSELYLRDSTTKQTNQIIFEEEGKGAITSVAFSPDGSKLAVGSENGSIYIYHIGTEARILYSLNIIPQGQVNSEISAIAWKDNFFLSVGTFQGTIYFIHLQNGRVPNTLDLARLTSYVQEENKPNKIYSLAWNSRKNYLAAGGSDKKIRVFTVKYTQTRLDFRLLTTISHHCQTKGFSWSPFNNRLLATSDIILNQEQKYSESSIKLWYILPNDDRPNAILKLETRVSTPITGLLWSQNSSQQNYILSFHGKSLTEESTLENGVALWQTNNQKTFARPLLQLSNFNEDSEREIEPVQYFTFDPIQGDLLTASSELVRISSASYLLKPVPPRTFEYYFLPTLR